jgi:hypothetical protein
MEQKHRAATNPIAALAKTVPAQAIGVKAKMYLRKVPHGLLHKPSQSS